MANIVYRSASLPGPNAASANKGSPLLNTEVDGNFRGINDELATKAPLASPALTGTPTAPTATAATNTTQLATTAFVHAERSNTATLTNKTLTDPTINAGGGTLVLPAATTPAQTAEGSIVWDSDSDLLTVGTGTARKTLADTDSSQDLTNKTVNKLTITAPATSATLTIANGKTFTLNNTLTFTGTDASSVAFGAGGTVAYTANKLSAFAATTSAELAGVISDETGSGALVFATSPTLATPTFTTSATTPTIHGSSAASGTLTLSSTSNATKGEVRLGGTGDVVKLNTTTAGFVKTNATGVFSVDTNTYYAAGGTDVAVADGGTGLSTAPTNGQLLIGNGTGYTLSTLTQGSGITVTNAAGSVTVAHTDTSTQASVNNSGNTFIQDITLDDFGHITAIVSATSTESDTLATVTSRGATTSTAISITNATTSTSISTGALVVTGGVGIGENINVGGNAVISGNLTVNGTTTTVNSTTVTVDDKNLELGSVATPTNTTADGGGITLKGTTDKTFNWVNSTAAWTSSEHLAVAAGKNIQISGATSGTATIVAPAVAGTPTLTLPTASGTIALTSNIIASTPNNVPDTLVLRDASGNFTAGVITATDFNSTSDATLKENISDLEGISLLEMINPVQFNWKENGKKSYGVIAQEIEKIMPELVGERTDGVKSVSYIPLIAMLIDAVKKLNKRINELEENTK